jgi:flavin reductase (DIM6/NTAB) family NADH-FMN oxidoreductase RutF
MQEVKPWEALKLRYPELIVLAVCQGKEGPPNVITIGWFMPTSIEPPMVAISVGKTRYSHDLIRDGREFVVAFPPEELRDAMLICGSESGRDVNKIQKSGLATAPAKIVKPPLLTQCAANLECKVVGECDSGDHTIFVGEVVAAWINPEVSQRKLFTLGPEKYGPISG